MVEIIAMVNSKDGVKTRSVKSGNSVLQHCIPQFLEKLESWLEILNTPLSSCRNPDFKVGLVL